MSVYRNYETFTVLGVEINLISEKLDHGYNTVAEINGKFHYLGNELANIASAIFAWQDVNGREMTNEELKKVLQDNHIIGEPTV